MDDTSPHLPWRACVNVFNPSTTSVTSELFHRLPTTDIRGFPPVRGGRPFLTWERIAHSVHVVALDETLVDRRRQRPLGLDGHPLEPSPPIQEVAPAQSGYSSRLPNAVWERLNVKRAVFL